MKRGWTKLVLMAASAMASPAYSADAASWTISLVPPEARDMGRAGLRCRVTDAKAGVVDVRVLDKSAEVLFLLDEVNGRYLVRDFRTLRSDAGPYPVLDRKKVPDSVRINIFSDVTVPTVGSPPENEIALIHRPGRYWLVSTSNYETEVENIDWIDACQFVVSGPAPVPNWRLSQSEKPLEPGETDPKGLRCTIVDPKAGIVNIGISDKRAHFIYLRDDHGGTYLIRNFERPNPRDKYRPLFDSKLVPDAIQVNLFQDLTDRFAFESRDRPVRMIHRPGEYSIVSADDSDGEMSLTEWLGKCRIGVR
jgi:hypothetical protein